MHERPGELEETLDRVQSTLNLQTRALRPREDADARKVTQQVPAGQEPGVRSRRCGFSLLSTRVSESPGRTPTPAPLRAPAPSVLALTRRRATQHRENSRSAHRRSHGGDPRAPPSGQPSHRLPRLLLVQRPRTSARD